MDIIIDDSGNEFIDRRAPSVELTKSTILTKSNGLKESTDEIFKFDEELWDSEDEPDGLPDEDDRTSESVKFVDVDELPECDEPVTVQVRYGYYDARPLLAKYRLLTILCNEEIIVSETMRVNQHVVGILVDENLKVIKQIRVVDMYPYEKRSTDFDNYGFPPVSYIGVAGL
jgi:hypothetical protein